LSESGLRITYLGHATTLLELDGVRVLTDPLLRSRVGHLRRLVPLAGPAADVVGRVDAVLVSHLHFDHFDPRSISMLGREVPVVVPPGGAGMLRRRGFRDVRSVGEGSEIRLGTVAIRAVHARHGGGRGAPWVRGPALGYVVGASTSIYFAGDTGLFPEMAALAGVDVALLPVAGWGPRLPEEGHLDPRRAAEALRLLRPRIAVPIHWGTLAPLWRPRGYPDRASPAVEFRRLAAEFAPDVDVQVLEPGRVLWLPPDPR
jgi:L-ascorbate metabolism protein UlaG (beta-lactamase superfamily)